MQLQAPSQSLKIHCWVAQDFTNKICLQWYKLKSQSSNLLTIYCRRVFNLQLSSMKKGVPHDLWLLEGDKERSRVSRCWNLEIWPYPGVFSSPHRNRHFISDLTSEQPLDDLVESRPSAFTASTKGHSPSPSLLFYQWKDISVPSPQGPKRGSNCRSTTHQ